MANSRFEYVRKFEQDDVLLPNTWTVIRVDGRGFHRFSAVHNFTKPDDDRALHLMNRCAVAVLNEYTDFVLAYGQSDEFSFVMKRDSNLYQRRTAKITSVVASLFAAHYVYHWNAFFPDVALQYPPCFDSRAVSYPTDRNLRDYMSWRQADCHINNLYNTCFWALVQQGGKTETEAEAALCGTVSADKNELLFSQFNINYNTLPALHRKGSVLSRRKVEREEFSATSGVLVKRMRNEVVVEHVDVIGDEYWLERPGLLLGEDVRSR